MSNHSAREMEEGIYRMSFVESLLVLVVIGLWLLAVISLAKKLERICNPPSILPNYSIHKKISISASTRRDRCSNESIQSTLPPPVNFIRATSEPAIDASPRATIFIRSPSETCLHVKSTSTLRMSTMSQHLTSPSVIELGQKTHRTSSVGSLTVPRTTSCHLQTETSRLNQPTLLDPKRIPSIVRRSLLDLHRRTLYSNSIPTTISPIRCIITTVGNSNSKSANVSTGGGGVGPTTPTKLPLLNRNHRPNDFEEEEFYRDSQSSD